MSTLSMRTVTYLMEYLGQFEFILKTILDCESEDQMGSFDAKKTAIENLMLGHVNSTLIQFRLGLLLHLSITIFLV